MKKILLLSLGMLTAWQSVYAAAADNKLTDDQPSAVASSHASAESNEYSIRGFLNKLGAKPERVRLSQHGYTRHERDDLQQAFAKLSYINNECKSCLLPLFTNVSTHKDWPDRILAKFIITRLAIQEMFAGTRSSGFSSSMTSASSEARNQTFSDIIKDMREETIQGAYWRLLDEQPDTYEAKLIMRQNQPTKPRETMSALQTWLETFKTKQINGEISSATDDLHRELDAVFQARCSQLYAERDHVQDHIAPGIAMLIGMQAKLRRQAQEAAEQTNPSSSLIGSLFGSWRS